MARNFRSSFTFGNAVAESDTLLSHAYYDNGDFESAASTLDKRCFLIGRTGSGKSATISQLQELFPQKVVRIEPENLSLPYITNLNIVKQLLSLGVHLEPFLKALWKHVILVEVIKHRYGISTPEKKKNILEQLKEKLSKDPAKIKAIDYLNEFGDKFWVETDERVKQIAETFVEKIGSVGDISASVQGIGAKASDNSEQTSTYEVRQEIAARYQRIVNEAQLPRLNEMIVILNDEILDSPNHFTYLVVDDLDKEWVDEDLANILIKNLFQAVIDMQRVKNLKILVALRLNIFQQLNYGAQSRGGQEEKFRELSIDIRWSEGDLKALLNHRAEAAMRFYGIEPIRSLSTMLPNTNKKMGDPLSYILSRTLMRPRDAIQYLNKCVREATGSDKITWDNIYRAEKGYSQERLLALRDEWKDPYLDIDKIFNGFRQKPARLTREQLTEVLDEVALLVADKDFRGTTWLTSMCELFWAGDYADKSWFQVYGDLMNLLYNIGFLGIATSRSGRARYSYQESTSLRDFDVSENVYFEVHPAFQQALGIVVENR